MNWFKMATINECKAFKQSVKHCVLVKVLKNKSEN